MTINFLSTRGGITPVKFDEAILQGFAPDGGLFVPNSIPKISKKQFEDWSKLKFTDLAFELLSIFIERSVIPAEDLEKIIYDSFSSFADREVVKIVPLNDFGNTYVMELFHGATLSFKDVAMGFLINVMDYLLKQRNQHINIVLATTGDTGPAAAWASKNKQNIDCWPLYPKGMISEQQERQMTTLNEPNVHPVGVVNCPDGGDDLDLVLAKLFSNNNLKKKLHLSSVNSINWCRVMVQAVHYFFGYYQIVDSLDEKIVFSVPTGAFGNMFGGYLARSMGLPVHSFICANNLNQTLHTAFSKGIFAKKDLIETKSSAIDIVVPYNFWRFLYFSIGADGNKLKEMMDEFSDKGIIKLDTTTLTSIRNGFKSYSINDKETFETIRKIYENSDYLVDPHTAIAIASSERLKNQFPDKCKIMCLATAHPAKFPDVIKDSLQPGEKLPDQAKHHSLDNASQLTENLHIFDLKSLQNDLIDAIELNDKR